MSPPVWFITGSSSGLGHALAKAVLGRGHRAVLAARNTAPVRALADAFSRSAIVVALDITKPDEVSRAVRDAEAGFGSVDVLVNNAGVGYLSAIEEGEDEAVRWQFDTNLFGPAALIRAVLPGMRARGRGTIVNVSSTAGVASFAGLGYYAASKFALEGLTEALWQEVEPLGLKVLLVEPGGFRTGMAGRTRVSPVIPAYAGTAGAFRDMVRNAPEETYPGDPERAASAIIALVESEDAPHRAILGSDAYATIMAKVDAAREEWAAGKALALSTDFPAPVTAEDVRGDAA